MKLEVLLGQIGLVSNNVRRPLPAGQLGVAEGVGKPGDLVLVKALSTEGAYSSQYTLNGALVKIEPGMLMLGVLGNRKSGTNVVGTIPAEGLRVSHGTHLHILSSSLITGHAEFVPPVLGGKAMEVEAQGLVNYNGDGKAFNIADGVCRADHYSGNVPLILVVGASAECGKTTVAAHLIKGFSAQRLAVAGVKLNGSGNIRDMQSMLSAGAFRYSDFVDAGLVTTYDVPRADYLRAMKGMMGELEQLINGSAPQVRVPEVIVGECGGDVCWANVPEFLQDHELMRNLRAIVVASSTFMEAYGVRCYLKELGVKGPVFFSKPIKTEPLYRKEKFSREFGAPFFDVLIPEESEELTRAVMRCL